MSSRALLLCPDPPSPPQSSALSLLSRALRPVAPADPSTSVSSRGPSKLLSLYFSEILGFNNTQHGREEGERERGRWRAAGGAGLGWSGRCRVGAEEKSTRAHLIWSKDKRTRESLEEEKKGRKAG
ncbi:hypothetical protein FCM35_KLT12855 [Carex littledalei]|uniref:Uncharacterized protein n=1 Tax=Carex littledalei TaxID=544730 RepID=A0A833QNK8_9POAL|nr:hypothetical protein FCM35_KLT12855 [Carex littledalei]